MKHNKVFVKEKQENYRELIQTLKSEITSLKKKLKKSKMTIKSLERAFDAGILNIDELIANKDIKEVVIKDNAVSRYKYKEKIKKDKVIVDIEKGEESMEEVRARFRRQYCKN